jgi:hypothetical protein
MKTKSSRGNQLTILNRRGNPRGELGLVYSVYAGFYWLRDARGFECCLLILCRKCDSLVSLESGLLILSIPKLVLIVDNRGIIGPALVHNGIAFGKKTHPKDHHWHEIVSFSQFGHPFSSKDTPSPRYWLLWPGVLAMIAISFTGKSILQNAKNI